MRKTDRRTSVQLAVVVLVLCVIWCHSLMPPSASSAESGWVVSFLSQWIRWEHLSFFVRKAAHFSEFAVLGVSLFAYLKNFFGVRPQGAVNALFGGLCAAVIDEWIQLFTGRGSAVADVVLDFSGCVFGVLLCMGIVQQITFSRRKRQDHI